MTRWEAGLKQLSLKVEYKYHACRTVNRILLAIGIIVIYYWGVELTVAHASTSALRTKNE